MSTKRFTDLPEAETISRDDIIAMVDVDDVSEAATGTSKKVTIGAVVDAALSFLPYRIERLLYSGDSVATTVTPASFFISPDGTKMFVLDTGTSPRLIEQFTLSTPWLLGSATSDGTLTITADGTGGGGLWFSPDGLNMYVANTSADVIRQYTLDTAWEIIGDTVTLLGSLSIIADTAAVRGIALSADGTKAYTLDATNAWLRQYNLSTPWLISSGVYSSVVAATSASGMWFTEDGAKVFYVNSATDTIVRNTLSAPYVTAAMTADLGGSVSVNAFQSAPLDVQFSPDGYKMFVIGTTGNRVQMFYTSAAVPEV